MRFGSGLPGQCRNHLTRPVEKDGSSAAHALFGLLLSVAVVTLRSPGHSSRRYLTVRRRPIRRGKRPNRDLQRLPDEAASEGKLRYKEQALAIADSTRTLSRTLQPEMKRRSGRPKLPDDQASEKTLARRRQRTAEKEGRELRKGIEENLRQEHAKGRAPDSVARAREIEASRTVPQDLPSTFKEKQELKRLLGQAKDKVIPRVKWDSLPEDVRTKLTKQGYRRAEGEEGTRKFDRHAAPGVHRGARQKGPRQGSRGKTGRKPTKKFEKFATSPEERQDRAKKRQKELQDDVADRRNEGKRREETPAPRTPTPETFTQPKKPSDPGPHQTGHIQPDRVRFPEKYEKHYIARKQHGEKWWEVVERLEEELARLEELDPDAPSGWTRGKGPARQDITASEMLREYRIALSIAEDNARIEADRGDAF